MTGQKKGRIYVGTSGWNYAHWKSNFYAGVPTKDWLRYCSTRFTAIEVNATFYRSQRRSTFEKWRNETSSHFKFAIKGNRYLTHNRKLKDPEEPLKRERERACGLGDKLSVVVWQLPRRFKKNPERLTVFLQSLKEWPEVRHSMEFRDASWFDDEVATALHKSRVAVCISDAPDWPMWHEVTTDLVYIRLHGHTATYQSKYSHSSLETWADQVCAWQAEGRDVHVYFDNDNAGHAPANAIELMEILARRA